MSKERIIDAFETALSQDSATAADTYDGLVKVLRQALETQGGFELTDLGVVSKNGGSLSVDAVQEQLASECNLDTSGVLLLCKALMDFLRKDLPDNKRTEIEGLGVLEFETTKPTIVKNSTTNQNVIHPGEKHIIFLPEADLAETLGTERIQLQPAGAFKEVLAGLRLESVLVVLSHLDRFGEILDYHFSQDGWKTMSTDSVVDAVQKVRAGQTYLIVLDDQVKKYQDLVKYMKFNLETAMIPIIMTRPADYQQGAQKEVEILCDEEVAQPFEIKRFLNLSDAELERSTEEQLLFLQEVHFRIPSTDAAVDKCVDWVDELTLISGINDEGRNAITNAFREAAGNAVRHGNQYEADVPADITYLLDKEKITIIVRDKGKGFDWKTQLEKAKSKSALEAARESREAGKVGGLGTKVMLQFMDKVEWNRDGSEIVITKYRNT